MNKISFDIVYGKNTEIDSIKLFPESEFQQLKIMLCGKYKIFDISKLHIYYKNSLLKPLSDTQKLKEIFKSQKIKLEISTNPLHTTEKNINKKKTDINPSKYICNNCRSNSAIYICEKCEEFLCDFCLQKKKHITHNKQILKIDEYSSLVKNFVKKMANELDEKIINDEAYKFMKYWEYDKEKEIKNVDIKYEFLKKQLEDIKQIEIDLLIFLNQDNEYNTLKDKIRETMNFFVNFDINEENNDIESIFKQKKNLVNMSSDLYNKYNIIKMQLLNYTKYLKEMQNFNQIFQNMIQEKFNFIKKRFNLNNNNINKIPFIINKESILNSRYITLNNNNGENYEDKSNSSINKYDNKNILNNNNKKINKSNKLLISVKKNTNKNKLTKSKENINLSPNLSPKLYKKKNKGHNSTSKFHSIIKIPESFDQKSIKSTKKEKNNKLKNILSSPILDINTSLNSKKNSNLYNSLQFSPNTKSYNYITINNFTNIINKTHEHLLFKLKNKIKILIFSFENQNFVEKNYIDRANFKKELTSEKDIIQINLYNKLYILSGKKHNKLYYYEPQTNSIYFINNTLYNHYYGVFVFCPKNKKLYLLGGNSQSGCEVYTPTIFQNYNQTSTSTLNKFYPKKNFWKKIPDLNEERQEFAAMYFNDYIYVFFGFSHLKGKNLSSIERININKNDKFDIIYINEQITLSSLSCALYHPEFDHGFEKEGILLLGGFDGNKYVENSLLFTPDKMKIRECDVIIPNITKHFQFLFHQESNFIQLDMNYNDEDTGINHENKNAQFIYDMKNNIHILTKDSYELLSEIQ